MVGPPGQPTAAKRVAIAHNTKAKEGHMTRRWNAALQSLVLVRLGQELGTSSDLAQAIAHSIDALVHALAGALAR
jgi:hypothetical protein